MNDELMDVEHRKTPLNGPHLYIQHKLNSSLHCFVYMSKLVGAGKVIRAKTVFFSPVFYSSWFYA